MRASAAAILALATASGCGSLLPHPPARGRAETGFLSAYGGLRLVDGRTGVFAWRWADADLGSFRAVLIEWPVLRRRHDDILPPPQVQRDLCDGLRTRLVEALGADRRVITSREEADRGAGGLLRVRVAVTSAIADRGDLPPEGEWQGWGDRPGRFSLECEVVDGFNARPLAKMVVFDRTRTLPAGSVTPWEESASLFVRWAADVAWLVQPPAGADDAETEGPGTDAAESDPVST